MKHTNTYTRNAAEAIAEALDSADYREHAGEWFMEIDSHGCGLTSVEQEINARGGLNFGTDAAQILRDRVADTRDYIEQFSAEEISDYSQLEWLADWIASAAGALELHRNAYRAE